MLHILVKGVYALANAAQFYLALIFAGAMLYAIYLLVTDLIF
jgi:hypothetical protein